METMIDSAPARRLVDGIITSLPTHRRAVIDEEVTYSDLSERVHHLKIMIRIKPGCDEWNVWLISNRILDMHRTGTVGWPDKLEFNPREKPYLTEMGELLRWLKKMNVNEYIKVEWRPPCSTAKMDSNGGIVATFRTSTGWKIDEWYQEYQ